MEKSLSSAGDWEAKNLTNELAQGRELARQLQAHLNAQSSSKENCEFLVQKIISSFDKGLLMLNYNNNIDGETLLYGKNSTSNGMSAASPPRSLNWSPHSDDSDREFKVDPDHKDAPRKRKSMPGWTKKVQICPETGLEGPLDDGYSWRKYGQKDILGAKHPRGYYRCTHRHVQGCLATKQVQRSDDDPTVFEITYRGRHTCNQSPDSNTAAPSATPEKQEPNSGVDHNPQAILFNMRTGLKVITENLDPQNLSSFPSSLDFPSTSNVTPENYPYFSSSTLMGDNNFLENLSPSFMSPQTSGGASYFSVAQIHMNNFVGRHDSQTAEAPDITSAATSTASSPTVNIDFQFDTMDFGSNFMFNSSGFFP